MTARISLNLGRTGGHRPPLQSEHFLPLGKAGPLGEGAAKRRVRVKQPSATLSQRAQRERDPALGGTLPEKVALLWASSDRVGLPHKECLEGALNEDKSHLDAVCCLCRGTGV